MRVKDAMNKVIVIEHDVSVKDAAKIMSNKNIGSLVVLNKNKIVGFLTEKDIMKNISFLWKKISVVMSKNVVTIDCNESLDNAALIMAERKIRRLPVTDGDKLVGIITSTDIIANSDVLNEDFFFD